MKIQIQTVPHQSQRYNTPGDYFEDADGIHFAISKTRDDYQFLILIHELIEWYLISKSGIKIETIDEYDKRFEQLRLKYPNIIGDMEPGHMQSAPYHDAHVFAETIEKMLANKLKVDWSKYDTQITKLLNKY